MSRYDDALAENPSLLDDLAAAESGVSVAARPPAAPVIASRGRSPDEHAKLLDLAKETRTPPRLAEAAPEAVRQKADLNRYDQLIDSNPGLVDWLQDYDNAVVSQDDHGPLAKIENAFRDMGEGLSIGWEQGSLQDPDHPGMQAAYQRLTGEQTPESELRRQEWKRQMQASRAKPGFASNAGRIPAYGVRQAETYLREFAQGAAPAAGAGILAGVSAPLAIPVITPVAITSGIALGKANTYLLSYKQNATLAFDEFMDLRDEAGQPMPENVARVAAMTVGAVNASLDMIGLKAVTGAVPTTQLTPEAVKEAMRRALSRPTFRKALLAAGQRAGRAVAVEGATEGLQEAFQVFMGELAKGQSGQVFKDADAGDVVKRVMQASLEGGLIAGSLAVPGQGVQVAIDVVDVRRSKSRYEAMKKIAEAKTESKTAGRAPDRVAAFVQQVAAGQAKVETVEIPAQKFTEYFQSVGADPEEAAGEMGVMAEAFRKARDQGGDITVPIADYVRAVSGTPADEALLPHARIGDAPSYVEIQAERERVMAILAEGKDSAFGEGKAADPANVAYQAIYGQILSAGVSERTADVMATLWQERLRARAERLGVDPAELWAAADVSIKKPLPDVLTKRGDTVVAELDADLDRLRRGDIPSQTEVFGKSLAEFLMERGGLRDEGGELAAIDAKKAFASMRGFRGLVNQSTGMTMASAAELAAQAGYIDVDEHGKFSDHDVVEALADEAAGTPRRRRDAGIDESKAGKREELLNLDQYLSEQGIDLKALTNEQVRAKLAETSAKPATERVMEQADTDEKRGRIAFGTDEKGRPQIRITILKKANFSTFVHETGHAFLEEMRRDVEMLRAKDAASLTPLQRGVIADFDALMKYLGVAPGAEITRDAHEKFARSFEAYAREGKAPSHALREAFQRFRQFLVRIYQTLKGLDVELTDKVRGIMDRMLATDEAISFAENRLASSPISPEVAKQLGMTNEQYATYVARRFAARDAAAEALSQDAIREHFKRQSAEYRDLRKTTEDEVRAETEALPVYRAMLMFTRGRAPGEGVKPFKLVKADVEGRYGAAGWVTDGKQKRPNIPKRLQQLKAIGGATDTVYSLRTAADVLGFKNADDMVSALIEAKPFEEYVRAETDRVLAERMDDPTRDARIIEAAIQEVLSDKRQALLFEELRILQPGSRRSDSLLAAVRASAKQAIGETVVGRLDPQSYLRKSERAAADFNKAMRDGDVELATAAKYRQIVMHELYKEAVRARDEAKIATGILRDAARKKAFERLAKAGVQYVEAMKALLSSVRLVTLTQKELAIRAQVRDFATALAESGEAVTMSEATLAAVEAAKERALNELTVAELRLLRDDVKNLSHIANRQASIMRQGEAVAREEAITAMVDRARSGSKGGKGAPIAESFMSGGEHALQTLSQMGMAIKGAETLIEWLDGGASGPWHSYFYDLANKGEYDREILRERFLRPLVDFTAGMNRKRRNELTEMVKIDTLGIELPRAVLISMALNFGTQSNLDRVIAGGFVDPSARNTVISLNMDTVDEITSKLSEADWTQIKTFWATLEGMWPEIQAFQERMGGLVPPKIEGRTITTPFGDVQGSYWPIVYNPRGSMAGAKQEVESSTAVGALMGNHSRATTGHSFLFERTVSAGPLLFDYSAVLSRHIDEVLTDLTHREFVIQATKILADPRVKLAMDDSISVAGSKSLEGMVARTIREDRAIGEAANKGWNTVIETLRRNTVLAAMGFKIGIVAGNVALAHFQAYARIVGQDAKAAYAAGLAQFYRHPVDSMKFVRDSSAMMRHRVQNLEHSYTTIMQEIAGRHDVIAGIARVAMSVHLGGDMIVTPAIWLGEYRRVLESGEADGHDAAVLAADKIIRQTQTAGAPKDLSAFEGQAWARRWGITMFYGPMRIMGNRMTDAAGRHGIVKTWPEALGVMLFAWILPAIMWDIVTGKEIDDEDEDGRIVDDIAFRWAVVTGAYPGLTIPIFRDVTNYVQRDVLGEYTTARMNPLADGVLMAYRAGKALKNETVAWIDGEDVDWRQVFSSILRGVGPATGLPTGQLETSGKFVYDVASGEFEPEDATDLKYLFKRRPEE